MILTDLDEARRVRRARCQPLLTFSRWPLPDLLAAIRGEHFPELATTPPVHFVRRGPLACICHVAGQSPAVYMHEILRFSAPLRLGTSYLYFGTGTNPKPVDPLVLAAADLGHVP